jgi:hypothetical protein
MIIFAYSSRIKNTQINKLNLSGEKLTIDTNIFIRQMKN